METVELLLAASAEVAVKTGIADVRQEDLLREIAATFPHFEMPSGDEIPFHATGCFQCDWLKEELDALRDKPVDGAMIRLIHQEMSCLSAKSWRWIVPHYIRYCLTAEADYNAMEAEFFVYNLMPEERFKADARERLSLLDRTQIDCLISFMKYLSLHEHWSEYFPEDIGKATAFLQDLKESRSE